MSKVHNNLAKILRAKPEVLLDLDKKMANLTGKKGMMEKIVEQNEMLVERTLEELGISRDCKAKDVYNALIEKLKDMDGQLFNILGMPDLSQLSSACGKLCEVAMKLKGLKKGFFIKKGKAIEMLEKFPLQKILDYFGYKTAGELIEKQGFTSVFSALRFVQDTQWMHKFFDEVYNDLTADDFEERDVELKVLETKWLDVAEKFLEKKYHNVSHLKEFGIIFVVPLKIDTPGETLRMFTLILHYLNEVPFYSKLFNKFAGKQNFTDKLKSLLRGDVPEYRDTGDENTWMIVQRYLAKDDENDPRLFLPHVNPEAEHWYKAEGDLAEISKLSGAQGHAFSYWQGLDFVGDFFKRGADTPIVNSSANTAGQAPLEAARARSASLPLTGQARMHANDTNEDLISFDLIDLTMSLVKKGETKYLYHQQEALWNKIFIEYMGRDKMNKLIEENIIEGFIQLK